MESLIEKIVNSGISPKPEVESLDFIWDWKSIAHEVMTKKEIKNHTYYHAFKIVNEGGRVVLRCKQFLFSPSWLPESGIMLLKESNQGQSFSACNVAPFRIEKLNLKQVFLDLAKYYSTMSLSTRMRVQSSFDALRKKLESLPNYQDSFVKMKLTDFQIQGQVEVNVPDNFTHLTDDVENIPELQGETFPEDFVEADFATECVPGLGNG